MARPSAYVGIDLGGTNIQAGIVSGDGHVIVRDSTKTKGEQGAPAVVGRIVALVNELLTMANLKITNVAGLGIGAPGAVDPEKGVVLTAVNLRWNNYPLAATLKRELNVPITVDNDVNAGTYGEFIAGAGKGHRDLFGIFVGTGIGGGLVLNGQLYHGAFKTAGEVGHTILRADGGIGRRSLEQLASRTAIVNLLNALMAANHPSLISDLTEGDGTKIRSKVLATALRRKDPLTRQVIHQAAREVGIAVANTVTLLSLPCVVVGGGVTEALKKPFVDAVRASFEEHVFPPDLKKCKVVASMLGDDAGVVGAAMLARQRVHAR